MSDILDRLFPYQCVECREFYNKLYGNRCPECFRKKKNEQDALNFEKKQNKTLNCEKGCKQKND